jgi:hypothetical protein
VALSSLGTPTPKGKNLASPVIPQILCDLSSPLNKEKKDRSQPGEFPVGGKKIDILVNIKTALMQRESRGVLEAPPTVLSQTSYTQTLIFNGSRKGPQTPLLV